MEGGFEYRQSISLTSVPATNYPMQFMLHKGAGNSAGNDIYLNNYCDNFPYDINFGSVADVKLDSWVQSASVSTDTAYVWVEVPTSSTGIYVYCGSSVNSVAKTDGAGYDVFPGFEKFGDITQNVVYLEQNNDYENWQIQPVQFINGSIFVVWEHAKQEVSNQDSSLMSAFSHDGGYTWTTPEIFTDTPNLKDSEAHFLLDGNTLYCIYAAFDIENSPYASTIYFRKSYDNALTWTNPVSIGTSNKKMVPTSRVIKLYNNPVYRDRICFPINKLNSDNNWVGAVFYSDDDGATWQESNEMAYTSTYKEMVEPTIVECSDGSLTALIRDNTAGLKFWYSRSTNGGQTWTNPVISGINNTKTRGHLLKLDNGDIVLLYIDKSATYDPGQLHIRRPFSIAYLDRATALTVLYTRDLIADGSLDWKGEVSDTGNGGLCELNNGNILITAGNEENEAPYFQRLFSMVISPGDIKIGLKNQWTNTNSLINYIDGYGSSGYLVADIPAYDTGTRSLRFKTAFTLPGYALVMRTKTPVWNASNGRINVGFGTYTYPTYTDAFNMRIQSTGTSISAQVSKASPQGLTGSATSTDSSASYFTDELKALSGNYTWWNGWERDQLAGVMTTNLPTSAIYPLIGGNNFAHDARWRSYIDSLFVRPVVASEPYASAYGTWEQTQISPEGDYIVSFTSIPAAPALGETVDFTLSIGTTPEVITRLYYSKSDLYSPTFAIESNFRLVGGTWYEYNATNPTGTTVSDYRPYHYISSFNSAGTKAMRVEIQSASGLTYDTATLTYTIDPNAPGSIPVYVDVIYGNSTAHTLMVGSELNVTNNDTGVTSGWFVLPTGHYRGSISRGDTYNLSAKWLNWTIQSVSITPGTTEEYIEVTIPLFPPNPTNATILWNFYGYDNQGVLQPLSGVKISYGYDDSLNMSGFPIYSNSQGIASWSAGIPTQTYTFTYSKSGYKSQTDTTVLLTNGMTKTVILEKQALFKILVSINMLDIAGNIIGTVPYALVNVSDSEDNVITSFSTNSDGSGFATVSPGMYKLSSSKAGYTSDYKIVTVNDWDIYAELNMVKQGATPLPTSTRPPTVTPTVFPSVFPTDENGGFGGQGGFAWLIYNFLRAFGFGGYEIPLVLSALVIGILFCIGAMTRSMPVAILGAVMGFALSTFWGWIPWYVFIVFALVVGIAVWKLWDR